MYYRDVAFSGDRRLQKKGDTSPKFLGGGFRNYIRLLPKPSYPALLLQDITLRGVPTLQVTIKCVMCQRRRTNYYANTFA